MTTKRAIMIFDLDGTVIDTSHRYRNGPDGHVDLDHWFRHSTPELIAKDSLLPLADIWRRYHSEGHMIVICTARSWAKHELMPCEAGPIYEKFFDDNNLPYHYLLYRDMAGPDHETLGDGELKVKLLTEWAERENIGDDWRRRCVMFDDNLRVLNAMKDIGVYAIDANIRNMFLKKRIA